MAIPFARTTRSLAADTARGALLAWAGAALLLAAWGAWFVAGRVQVVEVSRSARLEVSQAPHALATPLAGRIASSQLMIGRRVRAGEVLAELDASVPRLRLQEEQTRLQAMPPRLASLQQEIASVQAVLTADQRAAQAGLQGAQARVQEAAAGADFASDNERRLRGETASGSVAEIDALRAAAEARRLGAARDALQADGDRLALDARTRAQQGQAQIVGLQRAILALEGEMAGSRATIARLEQEIERHRVRAPMDGSLGEVLATSPGAYVAEGQTLATLVPSGELIIVAEFDPATALGRLQPGQIARLQLDGFPWAQYGGVSARVLRVAGEIREHLLRVELQPLAPTVASAAPAPVLQHGLTGLVEVGIEQVSPAVLLLRTAGQALGGAARPAGGSRGG